ncbi:MAG: Nre family DNA repair protein [Candidatus Nezhaarchaeales archaeon]
MPKKLIKKILLTGKENYWTVQALEDAKLALDLNFNEDYLKVRAGRTGLCVACKGSKFLCGKRRCPIIIKALSLLKLASKLNGLKLEGTSPPSIFVGRMGYPRVSIGPLTPPIKGDTGLFDTPELWLGKPIDEIVGFRLSLVRGKLNVKVTDAEANGRYLEAIQELAMARSPVDVDLTFTRKPRGLLLLDDDVQPMGPAAPLNSLSVDNPKPDQRIEKVYSDTDLKASDAILKLYENGVPVSRVQRAFSAGLMGIRGKRRFVPTRWSITAVDSLLSLRMMEKIRRYPLINDYAVYESNYLDNRFMVILMPNAWSYECIEAWYPSTLWNPDPNHLAIFGDFENYRGRTTYAAIGGCYYAARLAVTEFLEKERRQASALILREVHPGYLMPVGVWQVRENVRNALKRPPLKFNDLKEALNYISTKLAIPLTTWIKCSSLLRTALYQRRLTEHLI